MTLGPRGGYTRLWATVRAVEAQTGMTAVQMLTLHALMAYQGPRGELSRSAEAIAAEIGRDPATVRRALSELTRKTFHGPDGREAPILTRTAPARRGRAASYRLNVPREWGGE